MISIRKHIDSYKDPLTESSLVARGVHLCWLWLNLPNEPFRDSVKS